MQMEGNTSKKVTVYGSNLEANVVFFWKTPTALALQVFQCLLIDGENAGQDAIRNAEGFVITETEFEDFLQRHKDVPCLVPESNDTVSLFEILKLGLWHVWTILKLYLGKLYKVSFLLQQMRYSYLILDEYVSYKVTLLYHGSIVLHFNSGHKL